MKRFLILLLTFSTLSAFSQTGSFKGKIMDTTEKRPLHNAVVSLVYKKDSTLAAFKRTDKEGNFHFYNVQQGKYLMLISYPKFADLLEEVEIGESTDIGSMALTPTSVLLSEVIVRSGQAIRIKGDTTEFTADSFLVKDGATVEDLMKKLPGFQVNSKGEITAQGKRVDKVLVDGEEFFGDDPTMATQNISSKAVDKVQVYDTKTEQQNLTGISSGNEGKTINIKLKEDHKKGAFGKAHAGTDFSDYVDAKALYNKFVGKKKVSVYGTKSNLNTGSLNWEDKQKLGMEEDMQYDEIGGFYYSFGSDDGFSEWSLRGLPDSYSAGGLYSNKFDEEKKNVNFSYRFNRLGTENEGSTMSQYLRKNTTDYRNVFTNSSGWNQQHAVNGKFEWKLDSLTSLKLTTNALRKTTDIFSKTLTEFLDNNKVMRNNSNQNRENHALKLQMDNVLTYRQSFKKKNRLLIGTFRTGLVDDDQEGTITTVTNFFKGGAQDSTAIIDQMKKFDGRSQTMGAKITFNEPLSDKLGLVLDYAYNANKSSSYRNSFNKSASGKYDVVDTVFSNNFDLDANSHTAMAIFKYTSKKLKFSAGSGISNVKLDLKNIDNGILNNYDFLRVTPQAQIGYMIKTNTNMSVGYTGSTRQPSITQLQPLRDNSDPLYEFIGNPDLKVGFNHTFRANFHQSKALARRYLYVNASANFASNAIVNSTLFDTATGKQTYSPVNADGQRGWGFYSGWNKGGGNKKPGFGLNINANGGRNISFVDLNKNITTFNSVGFSTSFFYESEEKYSFEINPSIRYNSSSSSLQPNNSYHYYSYGGWFSGFVMLPGKLELRTDVNFDLREKTEAFSGNSNIINWNAHISRKVFKDKSGKIFLMTNDILDQNKGFDRTINSSIIQENRYSRVGQYVILKFEWTFNKMPGATK